jgi:hypothetical protein
MGAVHGLFLLVWKRFIVSRFVFSFVVWFWFCVCFVLGCRLALFIREPGLGNGLLEIAIVLRGPCMCGRGLSFWNFDAWVLLRVVGFVRASYLTGNFPIIGTPSDRK